MWTLLSVPLEKAPLSASVRKDDATMGVCERYCPRDGLVYVERWQMHLLREFRNLESYFRPTVCCFAELGNPLYTFLLLLFFLFAGRVPARPGDWSSCHLSCAVCCVAAPPPRTGRPRVRLEVAGAFRARWSIGHVPCNVQARFG